MGELGKYGSYYCVVCGCIFISDFRIDYRFCRYGGAMRRRALDYKFKTAKENGAKAYDCLPYYFPELRYYDYCFFRFYVRYTYNKNVEVEV